MEAAAREYEAAYGVHVHLQYGGSQTLLATLQVSPVGDLYVPGDEMYLSLARERGLVEESIPGASRLRETRDEIHELLETFKIERAPPRCT